MSYLSASEIAARRLPGLPSTPAKVRALAERDGWPSIAGTRRGQACRLYLVPGAHQQIVENDNLKAGDVPSISLDALTEKQREKAMHRAKVVARVVELAAQGLGVGDAITTASREHGDPFWTVRKWYVRVKDRARSEWLPLLVSRYKPGGANRSDCHPDAWAFFCDDYLRPSKPAFSAVYRRLLAVAEHRSWTPVPSLPTLMRRFEREVPQSTIRLRRHGREQLERMFPAQERTREHFGALGAVTADGHKFDVFVKWPDGTIGRPVAVVFQDLAYGKILSWRVDKSENADQVRLAFADMVEGTTSGAPGIPDHCYFDNGRGFAAKWITGRAPHRFRFRVREADPQGVAVALGCEVHWTTPYHGQSKPIERAFLDWCENIARHPLFDGAYCGSNPTAKPEDYGSRAVPLADFLRVMAAQVKEHNARRGRRAKACRGRSFDEAFAESYASRPIRRASEDQRRILLLAAEGVTVRSDTASLFLAGNRFWCDELAEHIGEQVVVRFDPENYHRGVYVYSSSADGKYIGFAACVDPTGFNDRAAARDFLRRRKAWVKAKKKLADEARRFTAEELGEAHMAAMGAPPAPQSAKVIKPLFKAPSAPKRDAADVVMGPTPEEVARQSATLDMVEELVGGSLSSMRRRSDRASNE